MRNRHFYEKKDICILEISTYFFTSSRKTVFHLFFIFYQDNFPLIQKFQRGMF